MRHHLAVVATEYLACLLGGRKTIECRFGRRGRPPHGAVRSGDLVWFKQSNGPVRAVASVRFVLAAEAMSPAAIQAWRAEYNDAICGAPSFWRGVPAGTAGSLIFLGRLCGCSPFVIRKSDRRAWVVLAAPPRPGERIASATPCDYAVASTACSTNSIRLPNGS